MPTTTIADELTSYHVKHDYRTNWKEDTKKDWKTDWADATIVSVTFSFDFSNPLNSGGLAAVLSF